MTSEKRKIRVRKHLLDDPTTVVRVRKDRVCFDCGLRKPTTRFRGEFVCSDCRQSTLDEKEARLAWTP